MIARLHRWWSARSLRAKAFSVASIPVLAGALAGAAFAIGQQADRVASDAVIHAIDTDAALDETLRLLVDVETGVRGYVITSDPAWLAPNEAALAALPAQVDALDRLVASDPAQAARAAALRPLIETRLRLAAELRDAVPIDDADRDRVRTLLNDGRAAMDELRGALGTMLAENAARLAADRAALEDTRRATEIVVGLTLAGGVLFSILAAVVLSVGVVNRLRRLADDAAGLARGDAPREPDGGDEIGRLARVLSEAHALLVARSAETTTALAEVQDLYDNAPVGYHSIDADGRIIRINETELRWLGRSRDEVIGRPIAEFLTDDGRRILADNLPGLVSTGRVRDVRLDLVAADGTLTPVRINGTAVRDADGRFLHSRSVVEDLTERQQAERWAAELFDSFDAPVVIYDPVRDEQGQVRDFERVYANPRLAELLRRPMTDLVGARLSQTTLPEYVSVTLETFTRILATGVSEQMAEMQVPDPSGGGTRLFVSRVSRLGGRIASVNRDVTVERNAVQEIEAAREAAETANRAKTEFLSRMSHELRTPLNAIIGFAQLLELEELDPDQLEYAQRILTGGRHLLELINEVLDISRIESRTLSISPEPVSVREAVRDVVDLVTPLTVEDGIVIDDRGVPGRPYVMADRHRLRQVLLNLVSNAVKYNRPGGTVRIAAEERPAASPGDAPALRFSIEDEGVGIDPGLLERVFVPFDRLGAERTTVEGTGLGLSLSKALVEAMDGRIGVSSVPGQGSTFWFELVHVSPEVLSGAAMTAPTAGPAPARQDGELEPRPRRLLYIEDNSANVRLVERALARRPGYQLISAMLGGVGLELAREHRPDLVLLDLHLPDLPGEEVLGRLRADPTTAGIPVVVLSADASERVRRDLLALGAIEYLSKPIDLAEFYRVVDAVTGANDGRAA